jgi:3-methylcrotonyl-CoA carboxylase beta subunit
LSGVTDHLAADDEHAIAICREIVSHLGDPPPEPWSA